MTATAKSSGPMDARIRARRARVRADAARRRQRRTLSLFALLLVVAGIAVALRSPLFDLTEVRVVGVDGERARAVQRAAALEPGQHLLTVPLEQAQRRVESLPWVAEAVVRRAPPSTIAIDVTRRVPLVTVETDGSSWQVDADAVLVDGGRVADAPPVLASGAELPELGQPIDSPAIRDAVEVHTTLPAWLRRRVEAYVVSAPGNLTLQLQVPPADPDEGDPTVVPVRFGGPDDLALKAEVIRVLLPQAAERGAALDVRAPANPVVVP